jgi:TnpA family transposase
VHATWGLISGMFTLELSQSTLVRKLCTLSGHHCACKAIFEFDKLIRSVYTLRYLRDPKLQRNVHRSQNRIESYYQLRSALAQVSGRPRAPTQGADRAGWRPPHPV